jgi:hypothetical protein
VACLSDLPVLLPWWSPLCMVSVEVGVKAILWAISGILTSAAAWIQQFQIYIVSYFRSKGPEPYQSLQMRMQVSQNDCHLVHCFSSWQPFFFVSSSALFGENWKIAKESTGNSCV